MKRTQCEPVAIRVDVRWIMALALVFCSALSMAASAGANESPQQQDTDVLLIPGSSTQTVS